MFPFTPQCLHQRESVELGQHDVDHGRVVRNRLGHFQAALPVRTMVHGKAALLQSVRNERTDLLVILNDENAHGEKGSADFQATPSKNSFSPKGVHWNKTLSSARLVLLSFAA